MVSRYCGDARRAIPRVLADAAHPLDAPGTAVYRLVVARLGDEQTAAYQLGMSVFNLLLFALDSLAIAAQALLGKELGERDLTAESGRAKARELKNRLVRMSLVYGVVTGVVAPVIGFFGNWIFTQDAPVAHPLRVGYPCDWRGAANSRICIRS